MAAGEGMDPNKKGNTKAFWIVTISMGVGIYLIVKYL